MDISSIDRAKAATACNSDSELARWLGVATSVIPGYKKRGYLPLEQSVKISEQTGVSLDWLILGKGEMRPENHAAPELHPEQKMLLTGFDSLTSEQQDSVFALIRRMTRGESVEQAVQHVINIHANVGQANAGNGNIENLNFSK